ncbi:MAG: hypothetical protein NZ739_10780 [Verrucomicrobiae bacterium]|nr:hypothetical protein [Verrucomicrobiae bacterium]MDW7981124.1 hypothetical protein [Verrucomicrobiales bacterium]
MRPPTNLQQRNVSGHTTLNSFYWSFKPQRKIGFRRFLGRPRFTSPRQRIAPQAGVGVDSKAAGATGLVLPHLRTLKGLLRQAVALAGKYNQAGVITQRPTRVYGS